MRSKIFVAVTLILDIIVIILAMKTCNEPEPVIIRETILDTVTIMEPVPADTFTIDSLTLVIGDLSRKLKSAEGDTTVRIVHDTVTNTVTVMLPVTQKHYSYRDTAEIWISGYSATLDSFKVVNRTEKLQAACKQPKCTFNVEAGLDAIITDNKIVPAVSLQGSVTIKTRYRIRCGAGVGYQGAPKAFMYAGFSYVIK